MVSTAPPLALGTVLGGRYELVEILGQGGHGIVYRARVSSAEHGRTEVAVKVMLRERLTTPGAVERFGRERALLERLEHPHTVRSFDFGTTDEGMPFIVFELYRGRTLEEEIAVN